MALLPRKTNLRLLIRRPAALLRAYRVPLALLLAAAVADAVTTYRNVRLYGTDIELHPAQRVVQHLLGPAVGVPVAKGIQLAFVAVVACYWRPWCRWLLYGCAALYAMAAVSNHYLLL